MHDHTHTADPGPSITDLRALVANPSTFTYEAIRAMAERALTALEDQPPRFQVVALDYGIGAGPLDERFGVVDTTPTRTLGDTTGLLVLRGTEPACRAVAAAANECPDCWDEGFDGTEAF